MKIKKLFFTFMVITMSSIIFTSCNDDDDTNQQLTTDRITDILCDLHDTHTPGWILQGTASADDYNSAETHSPESLKSNEYISAFSNKKMTYAGHLLQFFRDGSLRLIANGTGEIETGTWSLTSTDGNNYLQVNLYNQTVKGLILDIVSNFMLVKCDASPLFNNEITYCEFFFTPESMSTNPIINKLVAGCYTTAADPTFDFGKYRCTFEPNGWIIQGKATQANYRPSNLDNKLTPAEYISESAGSTHFTMVRNHINFNRDMTMTLTTPDVNGGTTTDGHWNLIDSKTLGLTFGTGNEIKAEIVTLADNYCLLLTTLPGDSEPHYYELFWNPEFALYNEFMDVLCTPNYKNKKGEVFPSQFFNGTEQYNLPDYGWIIYGVTNNQEYTSTTDHTNIEPNEYLSVKSNRRKFTRLGYNILFMRDYSLEITEFDGDKTVTYTGTWSLSQNGETADVTINLTKNGATDTQVVTLIKKSSDHILFRTITEQKADTKYFELFRNPEYAIATIN